MKIGIKSITLGIILILLFSPVISSISITSSENDPVKNQIKIQNINAEIMAALETIDGEFLRNLLEELVSFGPRMTGTYGCEKAGEYLYNKLTDWGLETRYQYWESFSDRRIPRYHR